MSAIDPILADPVRPGNRRRPAVIAPAAIGWRCADGPPQHVHGRTQVNIDTTTPMRDGEHMREVISTPDAPRSPLYSQGIKVGDHVFISGLVGIDVSTGQVAGPSIQQQTRQALTNCEAVLHTASATLSDVVEVGVLLHDYDDFAGMNEEWTAWFPVDHRRAPSPNWVPSSLASSSHPDDCDPRVDAARTRRAAAIDRRSLPAPALAGSLRYVAAQCTNNDAARHLAPGAASHRLYRFGRPLILSRRSPSRRQGGSR